MKNLLRLTCFIVLVALTIGCSAAPPPPPIVVTAPTTPSVPGEMVLSDPVVTFEAPNRVNFEVKYRFTKGKPDKFYVCDISFPGTKNVAAKNMASWELKSEGVIKDGMIIHNPPVSQFLITVSEADTPMDGFKKISNDLTGPVK